MYKKILVALENSKADKSLLPHMAEFAGKFGAELLLVHGADGWAARNFVKMKLTESEEMKADRAYLERVAGDLRKTGATVQVLLALGDPPAEILRVARKEHCDMIAMTMHGHRFIGDLVFGSTIHEVRHKSRVPVFLVR